MKRTGRKALSILLILCMVMSVFTGLALPIAATDKTIHTTTLVLAANKSQSNADEGWAWYAEAADGYEACTLVLDGVHFQLSGLNYALYTPANSTIILAEGSVNTIELIGQIGYYSIAIFGGGNLTIKGAGTLNAFACEVNTDYASYGSSGIWLNAGSLTVKEGAVVNAKGVGSRTAYSAGVYCNTGDITINGATLNCDVSKADNAEIVVPSYALYASGEINAVGATVSATVGNIAADKAAYGLYGKTGISLSDTDVTVGFASVIGSTDIRALYSSDGAVNGTGAIITNGTCDNSSYVSGTTKSIAPTDAAAAVTVSTPMGSPEIKLGAQKGAAITGKARSVTYTIETTNYTSAPTFDDGSVTWITNPHPGLSASVSGNTVTVTTTTDVAAGDYEFALTDGTTTSNTAVVTVVDMIYRSTLLNLTSAAAITTSDGIQITPDANGVYDCMDAEHWTWYSVEYDGHAANTLLVNGIDFGITTTTGVYLPADSTIEIAAGSVNTVAVGDSGSAYSPTNAIYGVGALTITGAGTLTGIAGAHNSTNEWDNSMNCGIKSTALTVSGGATVIGRSNQRAANACGINGGTFTITNATVTAEAILPNNASQGWKSYGIYGKKLTATGSTINVSLGNVISGKDAIGIYPSEGMELSGTTYTASFSPDSAANKYAVKIDNSYFIVGEDAVVTNGLCSGMSTATVPFTSGAIRNIKQDDASADVVLTVPDRNPKIEIGAASNVVIASKGGSATFTYLAKYFDVAPTLDDSSLVWITASHDGVTASVSGTEVTVTAAAGTAIGDYQFKLITGNVESPAATFSVAAKEPRNISLDFTNLSVLKKADNATAVSADANGVYAVEDEGWAWYSAEYDGHTANTLLLDGINLTADNNSYGVSLPAGAVIELVSGSNNKIQGLGGSEAAAILGASASDFAIKGAGILSVVAGKGSGAYGSYGILVNGNTGTMTVSDGADVRCTGVPGGNKSTGARVPNITVTNAKFSSIGGNATDSSTGVSGNPNGYFTINAGADVLLAGGTATNSIGISGGHITINGGEMIIKGGTYATDLVIDVVNTNVFASATTEVGTDKYSGGNYQNQKCLKAVYCDSRVGTEKFNSTNDASGANGNWTWKADTKTLTLSGVDITNASPYANAVKLADGATLVLEGRNRIIQTHGEEYYPIYSEGKVTIEGSGTLEAENEIGAASGDVICAIKVGELVINSGDITATTVNTGTGSGVIYTIYTDKLTVNGGLLKVFVTNGGGIVTDVFTQNGGVVKVLQTVENDRTGYYAVRHIQQSNDYLTNGFTFNGGYFEVISNNNGFYCNSFINNNGVVKVTSDGWAVNALKAEFNGGVSILKSSTERAVYSYDITGSNGELYWEPNGTSGYPSGYGSGLDFYSSEMYIVVAKDISAYSLNPSVGLDGHCLMGSAANESIGLVTGASYLDSFDGSGVLGGNVTVNATVACPNNTITATNLTVGADATVYGRISSSEVTSEGSIVSLGGATGIIVIGNFTVNGGSVVAHAGENAPYGSDIHAVKANKLVVDNAYMTAIGDYIYVTTGTAASLKITLAENTPNHKGFTLREGAAVTVYGNYPEITDAKVYSGPEATNSEGTLSASALYGAVTAPASFENGTYVKASDSGAVNTLLFTYEATQVAAEVKIDVAGATADASGSGWAWKNEAKTLVLSGVALAVTGGPAISVPAGTTVQLVGTNTATSTTDIAGDTMFVSAGAIKFEGSGTLELTSTKRVLTATALTVNSGYIIVTAAEENAIEVGNTTINGGYIKVHSFATSIVSTNDFTINNGFAKVSASGAGSIGIKTPIVNAYAGYIEVEGEKAIAPASGYTMVNNYDGVIKADGVVEGNINMTGGVVISNGGFSGPMAGNSLANDEAMFMYDGEGRLITTTNSRNKSNFYASSKAVFAKYVTIPFDTQGFPGVRSILENGGGMYLDGTWGGGDIHATETELTGGNYIKNFGYGNYSNVTITGTMVSSVFGMGTMYDGVTVSGGTIIALSEEENAMRLTDATVNDGANIISNGGILLQADTVNKTNDPADGHMLTMDGGYIFAETLVTDGAAIKDGSGSTAGSITANGGYITATAPAGTGLEIADNTTVTVTGNAKLTAIGNTAAVTGGEVAIDANATAIGASAIGNALTAATYDGGYKIGSDAAKVLCLAQKPDGATVTVEKATAADGVSTYGDSVTKTFNVTFAYFTEATEKAVVWCNMNGSTASAPEAGTALALSGGSVTFTTSATANTGDYYFKVTAKDTDGNTYSSAPYKFTVVKANATYAMMNVAATVPLCGTTSATVELPALPAGAKYDIQAHYAYDDEGGLYIGSGANIIGNTMSYHADSTASSGMWGTITVPVLDATNYNNYIMTVTVTSVEETRYSVGDLGISGFSIRTSGVQGLRFTATITDAVRSLTIANDGLTVIEAGVLAKATGNNYQISYFAGDSGTSTTKIGKSRTYFVDGGDTTDIYREKKDGKVSFSSVLIGIPETNWTTNFTFCSYMVVKRADGSTVAILGEQQTANITQIAKIVQGSDDYSTYDTAAKTYIDQVAAK